MQPELRQALHKESPLSPTHPPSPLPAPSVPSSSQSLSLPVFLSCLTDLTEATPEHMTYIWKLLLQFLHFTILPGIITSLVYHLFVCVCVCVTGGGREACVWGGGGQGLDEWMDGWVSVWACVCVRMCALTCMWVRAWVCGSPPPPRYSRILGPTLTPNFLTIGT